MTKLQVIDVEAMEQWSPAVDADAERAVLAAVVIDPQQPTVFRRVAAIVGRDDFYDPRHAVLWDALAALVARGEPLDAYTITAELTRSRSLHTVGGARFIGDVTDAMPTTAHAEAHAALVAKASQRRRLVAVAVKLARSAMDAARDPMQTRDVVLEDLRAVKGRAAKPADAMELVDGVLHAIDAQMEGTAPGLVPFGVSTLDAMSRGGMILGGTYVLAGREGTGKTTMVCQIGAETAERGDGVLYVALEGSKRAVGQTLMSYRSGVELTKIAREPHRLSQDDHTALQRAANAIASWPLHVVSGADCPATVAAIEAAARALPTMPRLIVVDHLLRVEGTGRYPEEHKRVEEVMPALVKMGERLGATVLLVAHIGRGESRNGLYHAPQSRDLAGGRTIEREAYGIILLHREDKHPTQKENVRSALVRGVVEVMAPKLREVGDGLYERMRFRGEVQRFEAFAERQDVSEWATEPVDEEPRAYGDAG